MISLRQGWIRVEFEKFPRQNREYDEGKNATNHFASALELPTFLQNFLHNYRVVFSL